MAALHSSRTGAALSTDTDLVALFERLNVPACVIDPDGVVQAWSEAMTKALGWASDQAVGRDAVALGVAVTDTGTAMAAMEQVAAGQSWHGRLPVVREDNSRLDAWWLATPLRDDAGRFAGTVLAMLDTVEPEPAVSAASDAQNAEEANLLLDAILTNAPVALAIFDRQFRYVRANEALAEINGLPAEAHIGVPIKELLPEIPDEAVLPVQQVFETGQAICGMEVTGETPARPGVPRFWNVSYFPVKLRGEVRWVGAVVLEETERYHLLNAEQEARIRAERIAEQLSRLQSITALLSATRTNEDVCSVLVNQGVAGVDATTAVLCLLTEKGDELELVRSVGLQRDTEANWSRFPLDAPVPACDAMRTGRPVLFTSLEERDRLYPMFKGVASRNEAFATVPLIVGRQAIGAVTFGWDEPRQFTTEDRQFLTALAEQCAQAIDRCRLAAADERERKRKEFLVEASTLLASSLEYEETIGQLARLVLPDLADSCAVHVAASDGRLELLTLAHVDPSHEELLRKLGTRDDSLLRQMGLDRVARTRQPLLVQAADYETWGTVAKDDEQRVQLQRLGIRSGMAVPLVASGQTLGVLSMAMSVSGRNYGPRDLSMAQELASRAAVAIQNARSHRALRDIALTLQRSLLPAARPSIPGLDVAAVYHPVSDSEVGGDFYDVFPISPGRWGVVMGDVCGKGVQAASLTALARYTVRAAAVGSDSPSQVLARLNQAVLDEGVDDRFCTIAHLFVEPVEGGGATVTLSCGGHPLPYLVETGGALRQIGRPGAGIGMFPEPDLVDTVHVLAPGEAIVLYTDGVLEARSPTGAFDPELFADALRTAAGESGVDAQGLADAVEAAVLAFEGGRARDDMAVLVLRVPAEGEAGS